MTSPVVHNPWSEQKWSITCMQGDIMLLSDLYVGYEYKMWGTMMTVGHMDLYPWNYHKKESRTSFHGKRVGKKRKQTRGTPVVK